MADQAARLRRRFEQTVVGGPLVWFETLGDALAWEERLWAAPAEELAVWWAARTPALAVPRAYASAAGFEDAAAASARRGWPVALRGSGGGCAPQGPGVVNLTWAPSPAQSAAGQYVIYEQLAANIVGACGAMGVAASVFSPPSTWCRGRFDVSAGGRKLAGLSQRRRLTPAPRTLAHAALSLDLDLGPAMEAIGAFCADLGRDERPTLETSTTVARVLEAGPRQ